MEDKKNHLVWLDMEMTGLDPIACVPIEVAVIITDGNLQEIPGAFYEAVIHQPEDALQNMPPIVVDMHTKNGLLDRVRLSTTTLEEADQAIHTLLRAHCQEGSAVLSGNTIGQDRRFIRRYFPQTETQLHYRQVDVSSVKEMVKRWYGPKAIFSKESSHTAMSDIRTSITELAYYRSNYFRSLDS